MDNICVYKHIRLDTNEVFYIGIGNKRRPYHKKGRSFHWNNIVESVGYRVEIIYPSVNREEAIQIEKNLIKHYGRRDLGLGPLVNFTDGGEGTPAIKKKFPEHLKKDVSKRMKGNSFRTGSKLSEEHKLSISLKLKGRSPSDKNRKISSIIHKGNKYSIGRKHSDEELYKMRNKDPLSTKKDIAIYLDTNTGIFYSVKELAKLLNVSDYKIKNNNYNNNFILTNK